MASARSTSDAGAARTLPLDMARECFAWLVTGPRPLSVDGAAFEGLPDRVIPLDELRDLLLRRRCPQATRDEVWAELVRRARREGATWTLACAGMALPALASAAGWLTARCRRADVFDIHAEVLRGFLAALASVDVDRPQVLVRLRWAAFRAGLAALSAELNAPVPLPAGFRSAPPRPPWGHPDLVLAEAVREGVLTQTEADLIGATRLEEVSVKQWAEAHATGLAATYAARKRAEVRLADYLRDRARDADPDDPVAGQTAGRVTPGDAADRSCRRPGGLSRSVASSPSGGRAQCATGNEETAAAAVENRAGCRVLGVREDNARATGSCQPGGARCA